MANVFDDMAQGSNNPTPVKRTERRFEPRSPANPLAVQGVGAVGALAMGAGFYGQFLRSSPYPLAASPWLLAAGALLVVGAAWAGTSAEPAVRVGDGGVGIEKGELRRMPWHAVEHIGWDAEQHRLTLQGRDDATRDFSAQVSLRAHPQAVAWIVKEARWRVPAVVDVGEAPIPEALDGAGQSLTLEPTQVVGKPCAASGRTIAFEPDARLCVRCGRVYHRAAVPPECRCGAAMGLEGS